MLKEAVPGEWLWLENLYLLEEGAVELYVVYTTSSGGIVRKYLQTVTEGELLCNLPASEKFPLKFLSIVTSSAKLRRIEWDNLLAEQISVACLENLLCTFFHRPETSLPPRRYHEAVLNDKMTLQAGDWLTVPKSKKLCWLTLPANSVGKSYQEKFIGTNEIFLFSSKEPILLERDAEICALSTEDIFAHFGKDFIRSALEVETARFCREYTNFFRAQEESAEEQLDNLVRTKKLLLENSRGELLKNLFSSIPFVNKVEDKTQPPVIYAIREIGAFLGVEKKSIKLAEGQRNFSSLTAAEERREILRTLSNSCNLYGRDVELEPDWHHKDIGALLVYRNGKPFAALPTSPSRYEYVDLEAGRRIPITNANVNEFDLKACIFFRGMPEDVDSLSKWFDWISTIPWKSDYWLILFCCVIAGFIPVIAPLATQTIFSDIIPDYDKQALLIVVQVVMVTSIAGALTQLVRSVAILRIKNRILISAESALWIKLLSLPANFFRRYQNGDLAMRMQGIGTLSNGLSSAAAGGIFNGIFCFWNLLVMFYHSYKMALLATFIWVIFTAISLFFSWRQVKFQRRKAEASGRVSGQVLQIFNGLNKFRLRAAEERALQLWTQRFSEEWKWNKKARQQGNWLIFFGQAQSVVLNFFIFYYAMTLFDLEKSNGILFLSQANFLSFNAAMGSFGTSLNGLRRGLVSVWGAMPALERIKPILQEQAEVSVSKLPAGELSGEIEVAHVNFRYKPDAPTVLRDVSFSIRPGTFLAIVGSSGSGKSTLLRVLLGLENATQGAVLYDGQDIRQMDITSVRRQIGVVMQHGQLMSGSVFSNIAGSLPLTMDDAWEVARLVGLEKDIKEMPMGMYTLIGEGGATFSGGQRQRLLIARSLVNHPRIVIFDEATSALDNETQAIVSATLDKMHATRIIVAHRLSTIRNADRIIVMDHGRIAEDGTYDELMNKGGIFSELAKRQIA